MKTILGLDLGTNSIGSALIKQNFEQKRGEIIYANSRIIPMSQDILSEFEKGNSVSQTAERTRYRSMRRLRERFLLRRERLNRVLNLLDFLPQHYADSLDRYGNFIENKEVKLSYHVNNEGKYEFLFKKSYNEMLADFRENHPQLLSLKPSGKENKIPYDWTIYYLRKKAITQKIEKEELAWLLLQFNQKRGYYQLRGEEEENRESKIENFHTLKVVDVQEGEGGKKEGEVWYSIVLENGWIYRRTSKFPLFDWKDKYRDFIVTTELNDDGSIKTDKYGNEKRSFRSPNEDDWTLLKKKTENDLTVSEKTVGEYIYDTLLQNPSQKIKGKLVQTIERDFYKAELKKILETQVKLHPELNDETIYQQATELLYKSNEDYRGSIQQKGFQYLFLDDIIFYQRPLKSKKSEIADCSFESRKYKDNEGKLIVEPLKCISRSHPLFQEFRIWQWMQNLRIYEREKQVNEKYQTDVDVTADFLKLEEDYVALFDFLNERKEIDQKSLIKYLLETKGLKGKQLTLAIGKYRWNFIDDDKKTYPCNETNSQINNRLKNVKDIHADFLTKGKEIALWHIFVYSNLELTP